MQSFPIRVNNIKIPPIKCQGIKSKLVPFILNTIKWDGKGIWIEPFLGSGVVLFNALPERAVISDTNKHIINFYRYVQQEKITSGKARVFLEKEGQTLLIKGEEHYYNIRNRFNKFGDPFDFLFLSRACFNGMMRFNGKGEFNVPFCRKPERFRQAYITKITNQIDMISKILRNRNWTFKVCDWRESLQTCNKDDFVYLDPPYFGRHTDYFNSWSEKEAEDLAYTVKALPCGFALSMWKENKYRKNDHLEKCWSGLHEETFDHFYHIGSTEDLRSNMTEVLLLKNGYYEIDKRKTYNIKLAEQLTLT